MFSTNTLAFIAENYWMNSKEWFTAHKDEYREYVQKPLEELTEALAPTVKEIDGELITDARTAVSRIYRDMRFAKGSLYRDMLWISFRRDKQAFPCWPEFYFVMSPKEFFYGCGYYSARADAMTELRRLILEKDEKFLEAKAALENQNAFVLEGDLYKRSKYGEHPEELRNWLDRKTVCFSCHPEVDALFEEDLAERIKETYLAMKPVYAFLVHAENQAVMRKAEV